MRLQIKNVKTTGLVVGAALLLTGSGSVDAASGAQPSSAATSDAAMSILLQGMPDKEKIRFSQDALEEMRESAAVLQKRVEEARKNKDITLLNGLNELLSSVNSLLRVAETANIMMQQAISLNNADKTEHEFRKIVISRYKVKELMARAALLTGDGASPGQDDDPTVVVEGGKPGGSATEDPDGSDTSEDEFPVMTQ